MVTRQTVADRLKAYVQGDHSLAELVAWAEEVMAEGDIDLADLELIRAIVSRLGLGDVEAFGLTWEELRAMLTQLGYRPQVVFEAAG